MISIIEEPIEDGSGVDREIFFREM